MSVGTLLRRCLEKGKKRRKQDILDARIEIVERAAQILIHQKCGV